MRRFKQSEKLLDDWASLAVLSRRFERADGAAARADIALEAMERLSALREEFGDELRDAMAIVSTANQTINTSRGQQISQYHRNRIGKLQKSIAAIDDALEGEGVAVDVEPIPTIQVAELTSQRKHLEYQLRDHTEKIDNRSHGVFLSQMRRRHR
jgi:hypothetical protein